MPDFKLTDNLGASVSVAPDAASIAKYFKTVPELLVQGKSLQQLSALNLADPAVKSLALGLSFHQPVALGTEGAQLTVKAGASAEIGVFVPKPGLDYAHGAKDSLLGSGKFKDSVPVGEHERYVSAGFEASVGASVSGGAGQLTFGFAPNSSISVTNYRKFDAYPTAPSLLEGIRTTVGSFCLPCEVEDLEAMAPDSVVRIEGAGSLKLSGAAELLTVVNPLASVALPGPLPQVKASAGASLEVGASFGISTDYELRIWKPGPNQVHFGYYARRGSELSLHATASAGVAAKLGQTDLLVKLLSSISSDAEADIDELMTVLDENRAAAIQATVKAGIERTLEAGLQYEFSALRSGEGAFLYSVDLSALDPAGRRALHNALRGDLTDLASEAALPAGIRCLNSVFNSLRERKQVFRVNLLGIYNHISISKLSLTGEYAYEPQTGQLTITDAASASRIGATVENIGRNPKAVRADIHKLRAVLAESFLITAAYKAESNVLGGPPKLKTVQTYFELHDRTDFKTMRAELDTAVGLGMMTRDEQNAAIAGVPEFGRTLAYAETSYDDAVTTSLFLNGDTPLPVEYYERAGRDAVQIIVHEGGEDAYRLEPMRDDELWRAMKSAGPFNFKPLFPGVKELGAIVNDYVLIAWWAEAMHGAAEKLAEMRRFLKSAGRAEAGDPAFKALHSDLAKHMQAVAANTKTDFGRPWGLIAVALAASLQGDARVTFAGPVLAIARHRAAAALAASASETEG